MADDITESLEPANFCKVFMILWAEPAGESGTTLITSRAQKDFIKGNYGESVFSKVRRFVVIRQSSHYCSALPILSYGHQGVSKSGTIKFEHGIVYVGRETPHPHRAELPRRGERGMQPWAIRIHPDDKSENLSDMSRINYGKVYTVEHNVKVKSLGVVDPESHQRLLLQFQSVWNDGHGAQITFAHGQPGSSTDVAGAGQSMSDDESAEESGEEAGGTIDQEKYENAVKAWRNQGLSKKEAVARVNRSMEKAKLKAQASAQPESESEPENEDDDSSNSEGADSEEQKWIKSTTAKLIERGLSKQNALRAAKLRLARERVEHAGEDVHDRGKGKGKRRATDTGSREQDDDGEDDDE